MGNRRWSCSGLLVFLLVPLFAQTKPNVILILADDLGYSDLGIYGQDSIKTPQLDRFGSEGMRFTQFYAGSTVCAPSRSVLMSGLNIGHTRIRGNIDGATFLDQDITLAEVFKNAGYATGLIGKWGLGDTSQTGAPNKQGFDYFYGYTNQNHAHNNYPTYLILNNHRVALRNVVPNEGIYGDGYATVRLDYTPDMFSDSALGFISKNKSRPFFLYYAATPPHANNQAASGLGMEVPDDGAYVSKSWPKVEKDYAAVVSRMDGHIGRLLQSLKDNGIDSNTLVLFFSDNGAHSEGGHSATFFKSSGILRGLKRDLYEGGIRVPAMARWPGHINAGRVSAHVGAFQDMMVTLAELARIPAPTGSDGISFAPTLLGQAGQSTHQYLYFWFNESGLKQSLIQGKWKAVNGELYDLSVDPSESKDVAAQNPAILQQLQALYLTSNSSQVTVLKLPTSGVRADKPWSGLSERLTRFLNWRVDGRRNR